MVRCITLPEQTALSCAVNFSSNLGTYLSDVMFSIRSWFVLAGHDTHTKEDEPAHATLYAPTNSESGWSASLAGLVIARLSLWEASKIMCIHNSFNYVAIYETVSSLR